MKSFKKVEDMMNKILGYLMPVLLVVSILFQIRKEKPDNWPSEREKVKLHHLHKNLREMPLSFEENWGQFPTSASYVARGKNYTFLFGPTLVKMKLDKWEKSNFPQRDVAGIEKMKRNPVDLDMSLIGANPLASSEPLNRLPGKANYLIGNDSSRWHTNIPSYEKIEFKNVYQGIDIIYYGNQHHLEYDFVVAPEADPQQIEWKFEGVDSTYLTDTGNLVVMASSSKIVFQEPILYQHLDDKKEYVLGGYELRGENRVGFYIDFFNEKYPLIIDPILIYSTYLGGNDGDYSSGIVVDEDGNAYIVGTTRSQNFPLANPLQNQMSGSDVFVSKLNADGSEFVFSTYIGGDSTEWGTDIAIDPEGNIYITGGTLSDNFPATGGFMNGPATKNDTTYFGDSISVKITITGDAFVTKLRSDGSAILYSTYLGGTGYEVAYGIDVDAAGNACVTGSTGSKDFPIANAFQAAISPVYYDAFVTKLTASGSALTFSTYLGGSGHEDVAGNPIAATPDGGVVVVGHTQSDDFPLINPIQNARMGGIGEGFITKFNAQGGIDFSTYFGGSSDDHINGVTIDWSGDIIITGYTWSDDIPLVNPFQDHRIQSSDAFITKLSNDGSSYRFSTFFGGNSSDEGTDIITTLDGDLFVLGTTWSTDIPVVDPIQEAKAGGRDLFLSHFNSDGSILFFSTYLGGSDWDGSSGIGGDLPSIALDDANNVYLTGRTESNDFPVDDAALLPAHAGHVDGFITKMDLNKDNIEIIRITPDPFSAQWFWVEETLRPGERWTFRTHFRYTLVSADTGVVRMFVETKDGLLLGENEVPIGRVTDGLKLNFASPEITIPDIDTDKIDTLYVKLKLFPENHQEPVASDSILYRIFIHKWTFMVYLDGDNDLEYFSVVDYLELVDVPSNDSLAVVIQYDRHPGYFDMWFDPQLGDLSTRNDWSETRRIFEHRNYIRIKRLGELNMGDPTTLRNFILWAMKKFPAKHYALILWDHGGGWKEQNLYRMGKQSPTPSFPLSPPGFSGRRGTFKDIIIDETDNDELYSSEIRSVLSEVPKIDLLGFDACLMSMIENAYQFREFADYMVGSQAIEPGYGWPYDTILKRLNDNPDMTAFELARIIVQEYGLSYPAEEEFVTQSATDLWKMGLASKALDNLSSLLIEKRPWGTIESILDQLKEFWPVPHRDLFHFAQLLKANTNDAKIKEACERLQTTIAGAVVANHHSIPEANANGLAIFFPKVLSEYEESYNWVDNIKLSDDTLWDEFLRLFLSRKSPVLDTYEPNNWLSQAYGPLLPETPYYSYFPFAGDKDFYFVTTGSTTDLTVTLSSPEGIVWDIAIYDAQGILLAKSSAGTSEQTVNLNELPSGTYYIEIISNDIPFPDTPYKLQVNYIGGRSGTVPLSFDDSEPDSSIYSPNAGDVIAMRFKAPTYPMRLEEISFYIESLDGAGSGGDGSFYVWIADYFGNKITPFLVSPNTGAMAKQSSIPGWFTVSLADSGIIMQNDFVAGIGFDGKNTPTIGIDTVDNGKSYKWDNSGKYWHSFAAGVFIRARVSYLSSPGRIGLSLPTLLESQIGDTLSVPLEISNVSPFGVDSLEMMLLFENPALEFISLDQDNSLTSDWTVVNLRSIPKGNLWIKMAKGTRIATDGLLFSTKFLVNDSAVVGDTLRIVIDQPILNTGELSVESTTGTILITSSTAVNEENVLPLRFVLKQNYPNPFNADTKIGFTVSKMASVRLEIFNLYGQKIRTLLNEIKQAGQYSVLWDGRNDHGEIVSSNVYLCRMTVNNQSVSRKLLLLR